MLQPWPTQGGSDSKGNVKKIKLFIPASDAFPMMNADVLKLITRKDLPGIHASEVFHISPLPTVNGSRRPAFCWEEVLSAPILAAIRLFGN
jgi:hypothetical protein